MDERHSDIGNVSMVVLVGTASTTSSGRTDSCTHRPGSDDGRHHRHGSSGDGTVSDFAIHPIGHTTPDWLSEIGRFLSDWRFPDGPPVGITHCTGGMC